MATSRVTNLQIFSPTSEGNTQYREFVKQVHDAIAAVGLEQTEDTGQINPATVNKPAVTDTDAGYEIWKFTDAAQATNPIFLKIIYGRESNNSPWLKLYVGEGSNGSGTLTGLQTTHGASGVETPHRIISHGGTTGEKDGELIVTFKDGIFVIGWMSEGDFQGTTSSWVAFGGVERLRDAEGKVTSGYVSYTQRENEGIEYQVVSGGVVHPNQAGSMQAIITNASSGISGEDTILGVFMPIGLKAHPPLIGLLATNENDFVGKTEGQVSRFGVNRTYVKVGSPGAERNSWAGNAQANVGIMLLAE